MGATALAAGTHRRVACELEPAIILQSVSVIYYTDSNNTAAKPQDSTYITT